MSDRNTGAAGEASVVTPAGYRRPGAPPRAGRRPQSLGAPGWEDGPVSTPPAAPTAQPAQPDAAQPDAAEPDAGLPGRRPVDAGLFEAVLFDMDGTLVDSAASVVRCWLRLAEEHGITTEALHAAAGHGRPRGTSWRGSSPRRTGRRRWRGSRTWR
jgi:sugar-phosphatase